MLAYQQSSCTSGLDPPIRREGEGRGTEKERGAAADAAPREYSPILGYTRKRT